MSNINSDKLNFILEATKSHKHNGKDFFDHLLQTSGIVEKLCQQIGVEDSEYLIDAALFHSIYGTAHFKNFKDDSLSREQVKKWIGEKAEGLTSVNDILGLEFSDDMKNEIKKEVWKRINKGDGTGSFAGQYLISFPQFEKIWGGSNHVFFGNEVKRYQKKRVAEIKHKNLKEGEFDENFFKQKMFVLYNSYSDHTVDKRTEEYFDKHGQMPDTPFKSAKQEKIDLYYGKRKPLVDERTSIINELDTIVRNKKKC